MRTISCMQPALQRVKQCEHNHGHCAHCWHSCHSYSVFLLFFCRLCQRQALSLHTSLKLVTLQLQAAATIATSSSSNSSSSNSSSTVQCRNSNTAHDYVSSICSGGTSTFCGTAHGYVYTWGNDVANDVAGSEPGPNSNDTHKVRFVLLRVYVQCAV
jgi:hypothetical protein